MRVSCSFVLVLLMQVAQLCLSSQSLADKEAFYAEVIKKSLNTQALNLTMARSAVARVSSPDTLQLEFNGMHLLHYMLDLFMRSRNIQQRKEIIDLTVLMVEKGGDVSVIQRNHPDLVSKSVIIRQMKLAKSLAERGAPPELNSMLFQMIYSLPCDTVPLAKLLLHADTIVRHTIASAAANSTATKSKHGIGIEELFPQGATGVRNLIASASLQVGAKPAVTGSDLSLFSESYVAHSERIGSDDMRNTGVLLSDIIRFLDEVGNVIHKDILKLKLPVQLSVHGSSSVSEELLQGEEEEERRKKDKITAVEFIKILTDSDENGRSSLHSLALAGAISMFHSLLDALLPSSSSQEHSANILSDTEKPVASKLIDGLVQQDIRGHSPISYLLMRFGETGSAGKLIERIKALFVAVEGAPLSAFTLPYSTDRHTTRSSSTSVTEAVIAAAKAAAVKDHGGWDTEKLPTSLLYSFPQQHPHFHPTTTNSSTINSNDMTNNTAPNFSDRHESAYTADTSSAAAAASREREQALSSDRCDILEHYGPMPSAEEIYRLYLSTGTPVVFRGAALGSSVRDNLNKNEFIKLFGKETVAVSTLPYAGSFGVKGRTSTLSEAADIKYNIPPSLITTDTGTGTGSLGKRSGTDTAEVLYAGCSDSGSSEPSKLSAFSSDDLPQYVFTTGSPSWRERLHRAAPIPAALTDILEAFTAPDQNSQQTKVSRSMTPAPDTYKTIANGESLQPKGPEAAKTSGSSTMTLESLSGVLELQFYLGPLGSGSPVHFHTHAINTLAYGEKRWFMFPPGESFYSTKPALEFALNDPKSASALQCTQRAGDVIYVPSLWGHSTLNMQQSIGVAHEFSLEPLCML